MLSLRELQLRFLATLNAGDREAGGAPAGQGTAAIDPILLGLVRGDSALDSRERLQIYADMYRERLVDVLREDFPRLLAALGDDEFTALACRYLARCPSTHPSVRHVGRATKNAAGTAWTQPRRREERDVLPQLASSTGCCRT